MIAALAIGAAPAAWAQGGGAGRTGVSVSPDPDTPAARAQAEAYWTASRLRDAKPVALPTPRVEGPQGLPRGAVIEAPELTRSVTRDAGGEGSPPRFDVGKALRRQLVDAPDGRQTAMPRANQRATSSFGAFFTTKRVTPDSTTTSYPYRTVGKLFFHDPRRGTNNVCSAAVIRPRVVATAGHCVSAPSTVAANRYFFTNFLFVPAFNNGAAPFGSWSVSRVFVSNGWFLSNGSVPNVSDIAVLVMRDQPVGGATRTIGSVTGWLGYQTNALSRNHLTLLGYPCNLDACSKMQETNAGSFASGGNNTWIYGSASRGGHSGGPWVQDFGVAPAGAPAGTLGLNRLVGITSYGPTATEPKYLGSSNLGDNFTSLLNTACASAPGNC